MQGEHIDYGYSGTTAIPKEVKSMKNTVLKLFGIEFSGKQLGFSVLALLIFGVMFKVTNALGLAEIGIVLSVAAAAPLFVLAFVKKHGLDYDDWLMVKRANTKYSTAVRKNDGMNEFEKLEDLYDRSVRGKQKNQKRRKRVTSRCQAFR